MKPITILLLFLLYQATTLIGQQDIIKGRLFAMPSVNVYSFGIGYEKIFRSKVGYSCCIIGTAIIRKMRMKIKKQVLEWA